LSKQSRLSYPRDLLALGITFAVIIALLPLFPRSELFWLLQATTFVPWAFWFLALRGTDILNWRTSVLLILSLGCQFLILLNLSMVAQFGSPAIRPEDGVTKVISAGLFLALIFTAGTTFNIACLQISKLKLLSCSALLLAATCLPLLVCVLLTPLLSDKTVIWAWNGAQAIGIVCAYGCAAIVQSSIESYRINQQD